MVILQNMRSIPSLRRSNVQGRCIITLIVISLAGHARIRTPTGRRHTITSYPRFRPIPQQRHRPSKSVTYTRLVSEFSAAPASIIWRDVLDHSTKPIAYTALAVPADVYERQRATISESVFPISLPRPPLRHHALDFRPPCSRGHDTCGPVAASVMLILVP
jgi:hypothetical protein